MAPSSRPPQAHPAACACRLCGLMTSLDRQWRDGTSTACWLKVDVEGFELDVLFSAERLIRMNAISNVIVEIGNAGAARVAARWSRAGRSSADARALLDL